jgi:hypothetical protein
MMRPLFGQIYQAQPYRQVMSSFPKGCWTMVSALQFLMNYYCMLTPLTVLAFWLRWHLPLALGSKLSLAAILAFVSEITNYASPSVFVSEHHSFELTNACVDQK